MITHANFAFRVPVSAWCLALLIPVLNGSLAAPNDSVSTSVEWPQFRGPRGDSVAPKADPPISWTENESIKWKIQPPGRGRSSPIVSGERIWLTTALEKGVVRTRIGPDDMQVADQISLRTICVDRNSGKILWQVTLFEVSNPEPVHWFNSWATPTPVVDAAQERVYCDFGAFGTACLEADTGKVLWKQQLAIDHQVGPGSSPVLWRNLLILVRDGRDAQYVAALDKQSGQIVWKTERPPIHASSGNAKKSFSSPLIVDHIGQVQVIAPAAHWAVSYDPNTGREFWRVRHGEGFSIGTSPAFSDGIVYFGTGCHKAQLWAVRADGRNDVTATHVVWKTLKQVPVMSSPVVIGKEIYWVSDDGMATCADTRTGEIHWQERLGGPSLASPLAARNRIYFFRQDGTTVVVRAGTQFERLAENPLPGTVVATPAIAGRSLFLRTDTHLYHIESDQQR